MAAENASREHIPGVLGGDLPEKELLAYEGGHDADVPSNKGAVKQKSDALDKETSGDPEKTDTRDASSVSSENEDRDLEKGTPVIAKEDEENEAPEPSDPNVVDWEGPDDPENPYNW